jgi:hypothetical protein
MSKARLVITAVITEKRPVGRVARSYGVARSWIYTLLARYGAEGEAAFEPRSRQPKTSASAIGEEVVELIVRLRKELSGRGWTRVTGPAVLEAFRACCAAHGVPASTLTDNGMACTTRFSGGRGGRNGFEHELRRLGVTEKNGKPSHRRPRGRSKGSGRRSRNGWPPSTPSPPASPSCRPSSTSSPTSTTTNGRTAPCPTAALPRSPTPPAPPSHPRQPRH